MAAPVVSFREAFLADLGNETILAALLTALNIAGRVGEARDAVVSELRAGVLPELDTFAEVAIALGARLKLDGEQAISSGQQAQGRANLGATGNCAGLLTIATSQTYLKPQIVTKLFVFACGGGAGGGGATSVNSVARAAGGGSAGSWAISLITAPSASYAVTIGAGGNGGVAGDSTGSNGGTTIFGPISASGGVGGQASGLGTTDMIIGSQSNVSTATGGAINVSGERGDAARKFAAGIRISGKGGTSPFGVGGRGLSVNSMSVDSAGSNAGGYGGGGAGAISSTTVDRAGGNGTSGIVVILEFI